MNSQGKVYLVGAGLGNIAHLTLRAYQLLTQAEVLIYDALVDPSIVNLTPSRCSRIHVGKRGGQSSTPQTEINQLIVEQARTGKRVIRLKGGDPFIFGRAMGEMQALIDAGCTFEVVPGISSVLAAPLLASIPLTDPVMSRCFAVFTAHELDVLDWETLSQLETLVILMGGRHLAEIIQRLQRHGKSSRTPIAVIQSAGRSQQQVWIGTLRDMMRQVVDKRLSPCVIVIGEVVQLRQFILQRFIQGQVVQDQVVQDRTLQDELWSFTTGVPDIKPMFSSESHPDTLPLTGKTILVTRSEGQSTQFRDLLIAQGAGVVEMPALVIGPPSSWQPLDHALMQLTTATEPGFDWLILTSANGVNYFFERLITQDKDLRALAGTRIAVVGKKTAEVLKQYGLQPDFIPPDFIADSLVENFPENLKHRRVLFPRVESGGRETLVQQFTASGAIVVEVPAYESRCPEKIEPVALTALQQRQVDVICFASSKTVKNFHSLTQSLDPELLTGIIIASIGPQTSEACRQYLGRVNIEATEYTIPGLVQAIVTWNQG